MNAARKVLVIEDDKTLAKIVAISLKKRGFEPVVVNNFETGLELLDNNIFAFVLTDIFMPGIGGIEGIKIVKERFKNIPIIAMSGGWDKMEPDKVLAAAKEIGADAGVKKPMSPSDFDQVLLKIKMGVTTETT